MNAFLLTGGLLYDGLGNPPWEADILIGDSKILQIERAGKVVFPGVPVWNVKGLSVSPGWIDVHAHSDVSLFAAPEAFGKISQGVTTEISGNCGLSAFPVLTGEVREHLRDLYALYDTVPDWSDFASYAERLERRQPAVNTVFLCGHNTLRANVSGYGPGKLSAGKQEEMNRILAGQLEQGAAGLSTGLLYTPGCFSDEAELLGLLRTAAAKNGIYATHLRSESKCLEEAVTEAIGLAEKSGVPLLISHLKTAKEENWPKLDRVLNLISEAVQRGAKIYADRYPYTFSQTSLSIVLGPPYDVMSDTAIRQTLRENPSAYALALRQLSASKRDWSRVILNQTRAGFAAGLTGITVSEAAAKTGKTPPELVMEILREDAPGSLAAFGGMSEENLKRILAVDRVCCGTDETARPADRSLGSSHPRGFGAFPRFVRLLREQKLPMEKIIRRLTSLPAQIFRLNQRGTVQPGMIADLVVFDEQKLDSSADFSHPHAPAEGIIQVYVNGQPAYDGGTRQVKIRAGKVLRRK